MTSITRRLAATIHQRVVNENLVAYRRLFTTTRIDAATDPYWKDALALFAVLDDGQRDILFHIIRQVTVDATSAVLGIFDGTHALNDRPEEIQVLVERQRLDRELQDAFLEIEETQSHRE